MFERVKEFCDLFLKYDLPGFDLVIYHKGECVLRYRNGYSDLEHKVAMTGKERYNIYSCTKMLTCTAAMQLWEKGLFSLKDKLSDYMPEFAEMTVQTENGVRPAKTPILIENLFEMTAGFTYNKNTPNLKQCGIDTDGRYPTRETMKYLAKDPLSFDPGTNWQYSLCHDVLAALIEVLSGEKFEDYVKKHIFDVVGMPGSALCLPERELDSIAEQYAYKDGKSVNIGKKIWNYQFGPEYASGGAGAVSTVDDYIRFLECLRTGVLLKKETVDLMQTDRLNDAEREGFAKAYGRRHGYGLGVRTPGLYPKYKDFGWGGAACAFFAIDTERELSLYYGTHVLASPVQGIRSMIYRIAAAEMFDPADFDGIQEDVKRLYNYDLTF